MDTLAPQGLDLHSTRQGVVDCDIHPVMRGPDVLRAYLPPQWRTHLDEYGSRYRQAWTDAPPYPKAAPALSRRDAWPPAGGPPGSDLGFMREQLLDAYGITHGILQVLSPNGRDQMNQAFGAAISTAVNDWLVDTWLQPEPRLRACINVCHDDAETAVVEIERCAATPGFVGVLLPSRSSEPLGRRRHWPIYAAAARHDLTLVIHTGGMNGIPTTAGGWPSVYLEDHHGHALSVQSALTSMVLEGVLERWPGLRLAIVEAGFAWAAPLMWRMDKHAARMRSELPHLRRPPSAYIREHVWFTTQPVDEAEDPADVLTAIDALGWDRLLFSTDYPHWDMDDPRFLFRAKLHPAQRDALFQANAHRAFRLDR